MYVVEGELVTRENPETFLGQFGVFHESINWTLGGMTTNMIWATGNERIVNFKAGRMRKHGHIPVDAAVEKIESIEQAQKYSQPKREIVRIARHREPDLAELLSQKVPEDAELLEGVAQMWKDRRIPTPYIYFSALGKLLADVQYDPQKGWHDRYEAPFSVEGTRSVTGLVTPLLRLTSTKTKITQYRSRL